MKTESIICISIVLGLMAAVYLFKKISDTDFTKIPLTVVIEKTRTGYSAYCKEIDGITAVEDNIPALKDQFYEAFISMLHYQDVINGKYADMYPSDFEITYVEK